MSQPTSDPAPPDSGSALTFAIAAIVIAAALSVIAAHAPARIRLLGLFSLGFGLICGWLLTRLAATLHVRLDAPKLALIATVTLAGLITSVCQTVALQPVKPRDAIPHPIAALVAAQLGETPAQQPVPTFGGRLRTHLIRRVEKLGEWSSPWPEIFWTTELLVGTAGSVWIAVRCRPSEAAK